jgi:hypothetical protein
VPKNPPRAAAFLQPSACTILDPCFNESLLASAFECAPVTTGRTFERTVMHKELNAEDILRFIERDHWNSNYTVGVSEFCPYQEGRRLDAFYLNRWNRETKGYEIKISRADFLSDKKWQEYLKFCTWFSFVAPIGLIEKDELPEKIGLVEIEVKECEKGWYKDEIAEGEKFYRLEKKITKRAQRLRGKIEEQEYTRLLEGLLVKLIYQKNVLKTSG